jgi:hypothetical protein
MPIHVSAAAALKREMSESGFQVDICASTRSTAACSKVPIMGASVPEGAKKMAEKRVPMVGPFRA